MNGQPKVDWGEITSAWFRMPTIGNDDREPVLEWSARYSVERPSRDPVVTNYVIATKLHGELAALARAFLAGDCPLGIVLDRLEEAPGEMNRYGEDLPTDDIIRVLRRTGRTRLGDLP